MTDANYQAEGLPIAELSPVSRMADIIAAAQARHSRILGYVIDLADETGHYEHPDVIDNVTTGEGLVGSEWRTSCRRLLFLQCMQLDPHPPFSKVAGLKIDAEAIQSAIDASQLPPFDEARTALLASIKQVQAQIKLAAAMAIAAEPRPPIFDPVIFGQEAESDVLPKRIRRTMSLPLNPPREQVTSIQDIPIFFDYNPRKRGRGNSLRHRH